ncbi:CLUMA_CG007273, isoform A [Clunio marinus]|uniref:CLUMA_CG007273, isoform A n=1 Tax=Clunio marinus TaxID=568069 RepID=A0A1J1I5T6_9DIPT|nr:CLUMA_CG007273, isoform A [Clunio marinus]
MSKGNKSFPHHHVNKHFVIHLWLPHMSTKASLEIVFQAHHERVDCSINKILLKVCMCKI